MPKYRITRTEIVTKVFEIVDIDEDSAMDALSMYIYPNFPVEVDDGVVLVNEYGAGEPQVEIEEVKEI